MGLELSDCRQRRRVFLVVTALVVLLAIFADHTALLPLPDAEGGRVLCRARHLGDPHGNRNPTPLLPGPLLHPDLRTCLPDSPLSAVFNKPV